MGPSVAIDLGILQIHWYGIILTFGMVMATYITALQAKRRDENAAIVWDAVLIVIGLGLGIYGGLLGGIIGILFVVYRNKVRLFRWLDFAVPGVLLAQAIGRWGNYANQELYGGPTGSSWWGITIDQAFRTRTPKIDFTDMQQYPAETRFHPTFFYESAWNFIGFVTLMYISRRFERRLRDGDIAALYFVWYGIGRGWVELLFRPDAWTIGSLPTAVWVSIGAILLGLLAIVVNRLIPQPRAAIAVAA